MIRSAHRIPSAMALTVAGTRAPLSYCASFGKGRQKSRRRSATRASDLVHTDQRSIFAFYSLYWVFEVIPMEASTHSTPSTVQNVGSMKPQSARHPKLDEIGEWSELKLDILKKYAGAYCTILKARGLRPIYIDGFAGAGVHIRKGTTELVPGSPLNALKVEPPFEEHHWIDLDESKVAALKRHTAGLKHVHIYGGDANKILLNEVFPRVRFENFERALCILDPYGLHLNWEVIETAAKMGTIEIFLNFPMLDMNRNVLLWEPTNASADDVKRMTAL
jgi:hypothetical protein